METVELFNKIKEKFPFCLFTHKGKIIKMHEASMHDGLKAFEFTRFSFPYKLGLHYEIANYLEENKYYYELKDEKLLIKKE